MQRVPLQNIPAQQFSIVLDGQNSVVTLRQLGGALFMDLEVNGEKVVSGHICQNCEPIPVWSSAVAYFSTIRSGKNILAMTSSANDSSFFSSRRTNGRNL